MTQNDEIKKLMEKAEHNIYAAQIEYKNGIYDVLVSRAYYAMFYAAEALLLTKSLRFSKHSAVHAALGKYFAKTGEVKQELHKMLLNAFNIRSTADYDYVEEITKEQGEKTLKDAEYFVNEIKKKLIQSH